MEGLNSWRKVCEKGDGTFEDHRDPKNMSYPYELQERGWYRLEKG